MSTHAKTKAAKLITIKMFVLFLSACGSVWKDARRQHITRPREESKIQPVNLPPPGACWDLSLKTSDLSSKILREPKGKINRQKFRLADTPKIRDALLLL